MFDPEAARAPGAPLLHADKARRFAHRRPIAQHRRRGARRNRRHRRRRPCGNGFRRRGGPRQRYTTQRVQHAHLETHGCTGWIDEAGRLVLRASTQVPFLVRDELCHLFGLDRDGVQVFTRRVGGGFGGKQEMLTEDIVALAVLRLGQACALRVQPRGPVHARAVPAPVPHRRHRRRRRGRGADGAGRRRADGCRRLRQPQHRASCSTAARNRCRCTAARTSASTPRPSTRTTCRRGRSAGYGLGQMIFAIESALDELALRLGIDPFDFRRRNVVVPGDEFIDHSVGHGDLTFGSYGLDQCLDLTQAGAGGRQRSDGAPTGGRVGEGMAVAMIATIPPRGHFAEASVARRPPTGTTCCRWAPPNSATAPPPCTPSWWPPNSTPPPTAS